MSTNKELVGKVGNKIDLDGTIDWNDLHLSELWKVKLLVIMSSSAYISPTASQMHRFWKHEN